MSHTVDLENHELSVRTAISALTSNGVYSKRLHSISTENTISDTSLRAIGVLGLSLCYYRAYEMRKHFDE